jgi:hypothetical protein
LDGDGPLASGDTGFPVYVSPVSRIVPPDLGLFPTSIYNNLTTLLLTCDECTNRTVRAALQLSCGIQNLDTNFTRTSVAGTRRVKLEATEAPNEFTVTFDGVGLAIGATYALCLKYEANSQGNSGITLYVSSVLDVRPISASSTTITKGKFSLQLKCGEFCMISGANQTATLPSLALAVNCTERLLERGLKGTVAYGDPLVERDGVWYTAVSAADLRVGENFHVCLDYDADGEEFAMGSTGFVIYTSPSEVPKPHVVQPSTTASVSLLCDECTNATAIYLSTECDVTAHELNPYVPSMSFAGPIEYLTASTVGWEVTMDTTNLTLGSFYSVCLDLDGEDAALPFGNTGVLLYVTGAFLLHPAVYADRRSVYIDCKVCTSETMLYLSLECDATTMDADIVPEPGSHTGAEALNRHGAFWVAHVDASGLDAGRFYAVCVDQDGTAPGVGMGDTGLRVYMSGVQHVTAAIQRGVNQTVNFVCEGCSETRPRILLHHATSAATLPR